MIKRSVIAALKKKIKIDIDRLLVVDDSRRELMTRLETKKANQNRVSQDIAKGSDPVIRSQLIADMQLLKVEIQKDEEVLKSIMEEWQALMLQVPNVPDMSVPDGDSDADNLEIKTWGEQTTFAFPAKDHVELMTKHLLADFERGVKVHGFRGYYLRGDGARLSWAIWNYAHKFFLDKGFEPLLVPTIVRRSNLYGTGHLPNEAEDVYKTQDEDYLIGTAEVSTMGFYADEVLEQSQLPVKFLAFSPCYRREAGSHGKDTKGLIRVHEFFKLEQVILCEASHELSVNFHEELLKNTEDIMQELGIPYRVILMCTADIGLGHVKKYDIEAWVPSQNTYSCLLYTSPSPRD